MENRTTAFSDDNMGAESKAEPEEILEITVHCMEGPCVQGKHMGIAMVPFTGEASGPYFHGRIIGTGTDTQRVREGRIALLSARYMLEGRDHTGRDCRIFIENNGSSLEHCVPVIVTDSDALSAWEDAELFSRVETWGDGVKVHIFMTAEHKPTMA